MNNKNAEIFKHWLVDREEDVFNFVDSDKDSELTIARYQDRLENGASFDIDILFKDNNVSVYLTDLVRFAENSLTLDLFKKINELNIKYTIPKFSINYGQVFLQISNDYSEVCDPQEIFTYVIGLMRIAEAVYPELMKTIWS